MVHTIQVDQTLATFPKLFHTAAEEQHATKPKAKKRRFDEQHRPAARTPISAARNRKCRKPNNDDNDMSDSSDSDNSQEGDDNRADNNTGTHNGGR